MQTVTYYTLEQAKEIIKRDKKRKAMRKSKKRKALFKKSLRSILGIITILLGIAIPFYQPMEILTVLSWIIVACLLCLSMLGLIALGLLLLFK